VRNFIEYISNIDVGDIAGASGTVMKTKKGELSIELKILFF
jgi:lysyl-tRNA synthetase class II